MTKIAIMREPSRSYPIQNGSGVNFRKALRQHQALRGVYKRHGYKVELLPNSWKYFGGTFVQDTAFISGDQALLTNCMSAWRLKEPRHRGQLARLLSKYVDVVGVMGLPAELDGGEVVKTDTEYLVGISKKAAYYGIKQIRERLDLDRPIRSCKRDPDGLCHLGSGVSYLGYRYLLVFEMMQHYSFTSRYKVIEVPLEEENGANVVRLADGCLIAQAEAPKTVARLRKMGWDVETVELSEFNKGNGHISCLSLNIEL